MIGNKYPNIASGATPIGSADRAPDRKYFRAAIAKGDGKSSSPLLGGKHQKHRLVIYSHRERRLRT